MNKQEIFNHYSTIIDEMINNSLFWSTYWQRPWSFGSTIDGSDYDEMPAHILIQGGVTRTCIVDQDYDWVVKIDVEEDAYGSACEREEQIYDAAKAYALDRYFAEVMFLGTYTREINFYDIMDVERWCDMFDYDPEYFEKAFSENEEKFGPIRPITISIPLYAYRRADTYDCGPVDADSRARAKKIASPLYSRNIAVATAFIREFGMDEYKAFSEFSLEWDINDLHCNNIGEIDGHFCIIDYSGYHDCYSEETESYESWKKGSSESDE